MRQSPRRARRNRPNRPSRRRRRYPVPVSATDVPETAPAGFDFSGLDAQTVADLHLAEREYVGGKKMAEMGLRRMADAVAIAHDALCGHRCDNLSQR